MLDFFLIRTERTEFFTLSLHDALPIFADDIEEGEHARFGAIDDAGFELLEVAPARASGVGDGGDAGAKGEAIDRKSTRLNSSHVKISYAVFCLKKKIRNKHVVLHA